MTDTHTDVTRLYDLTGRAEVELTGKDRIELLQGLVTNDVKALKPGSSCHAALLTPKGRMRADLRVLALDERVLLDAEPSLAETLAPLVRSFVFFQEVVVRDLGPRRGVLHVAGAFAGSALSRAGAGALPEGDGAVASGRVAGCEALLVRTDRTGGAGFDVRVSRDEVPEVTRALLSAGALASTADDFEARRIAAGIPRWGADLDETVLPNEALFERDAISYSKGCYVGQETVARIRTYGHVNRRLVRLELRGRVPAGTELRAGDTKVGTITSVSPADEDGLVNALGFVKRDVAPGTAVVAAGERGPVEGTLRDIDA